MSEKAKVLHLFTAQYPYGAKSETFLETEIIYLSKKFDKVIIYPSSLNEFCREIPSQVSVNKMLCELQSKQKSKILFANLGISFTILFNELKTKGVSVFLKNIKFFADHLSIQLSKYTVLKESNVFNPSDIYYDYWFENTTVSLSIARNFNEIKSFVSRGHGFDIYDKRWKKTGVPFRNFKLENVDKLFLISNYGKEYLKKKIKPELLPKLNISKLGVNTYESETKQPHEKKLIVSCASLLPFKNIDKIPALLKQTGQAFHWIHFGSGPEMSNVEKAIVDLPEGVTAELKGHVSNSKIIEFYQSNFVDLFVSMSSTEGLPVSMMEAQSFAIPIWSVAVGGIPEIVIPKKTGFLVDEKMSEKDKIESLKAALNHPFDRNLIQSFFTSNFNAESNYNMFIAEICSSKN